MKFFVMKTKAKSGKEYIALFADMGNRKLAINFDIATISQVSDMKINELYDLPLNEKVYI